MPRAITTLPRPPRELDVEFAQDLSRQELDLELYKYLSRLVRAIEVAVYQSSRVFADRWQPANVPATGSRDVDASTATLDETRKALARLIQDLKDGGALAGPTV